MIQFDKHIFQMGWFHHHLGLILGVIPSQSLTASFPLKAMMVGRRLPFSLVPGNFSLSMLHFGGVPFLMAKRNPLRTPSGV